MSSYDEHLISQAGGDGEAGVRLMEFGDEPNWLRISRTYEDLRATTKDLFSDIQLYNEALNTLDGLGTSISNARGRISILRERIAELEATK